jgi:hypothetical protein
MDESSRLMDVELNLSHPGNCAKDNLPLAQLKNKILCATGGNSERDTCQVLIYFCKLCKNSQQYKIISNYVRNIEI